MLDRNDDKQSTLALPSGAPQVRITAGLGSAGQKTWNLRRPVTLIGSRRPAHIVLHDKDIAKAHCLIVNTGGEVLIKDLHTGVGTFLNREKTDLAVVKDGDIVTVGETHMQIAIQVPEDPSDDSGCGIEYADPLRFPMPVTVRLLRTDKVFVVESAVAMIGRHDEAPIRLDHDDISHRHAVMFRFCGKPAVFDLASREGLWVNGKRVPLASLENQDCVTVGPFGLSVHAIERASLEAGATPAMANAAVAPMTASAAEAAVPAPTLNGKATAVTDPSITVADSPPATKGRLSAIEAELSALQQNISEAWNQLNNWPATSGQPAPDATLVNGLSARAAELDAKDAELRGRLHDVTHLHDQLAERERDIAARMAAMQKEQEALDAAGKALAEQQQELSKAQADVQRRENAMAQRWQRIRTAICPNCGQPMNLGQLGGA